MPQSAARLAKDGLGPNCNIAIGVPLHNIRSELGHRHVKVTRQRFANVPVTAAFANVKYAKSDIPALTLKTDVNHSFFVRDQFVDHSHLH